MDILEESSNLKIEAVGSFEMSAHFYPLCGVISQNTLFFIFIGMETSDLTWQS